jgi:hypothetical protein
VSSGSGEEVVRIEGAEETAEIRGEGERRSEKDGGRKTEAPD